MRKLEKGQVCLVSMYMNRSTCIRSDSSARGITSLPSRNSESVLPCKWEKVSALDLLS